MLDWDWVGVTVGLDETGRERLGKTLELLGLSSSSVGVWLESVLGLIGVGLG